MIILFYYTMVNYHGVLKHTRRYLPFTCFTMVLCHGILPWFTMVFYHGILPWFTCFKTQWLTMVLFYHGILPWYTMVKYHGIPWFTCFKTPWFTMVFFHKGGLSRVQLGLSRIQYIVPFMIVRPRYVSMMVSTSRAAVPISGFTIVDDVGYFQH